MQLSDPAGESFSLGFSITLLGRSKSVIFTMPGPLSR